MGEWNKLSNKDAFKAYLLQRGKVGNDDNPAICWWAANVYRRVMRLAGDWLTDGRSMVRLPDWAKSLPASCRAEDVK